MHENIVSRRHLNHVADPTTAQTQTPLVLKYIPFFAWLKRPFLDILKFLLDFTTNEITQSRNLVYFLCCTNLNLQEKIKHLIARKKKQKTV